MNSEDEKDKNTRKKLAKKNERKRKENTKNEEKKHNTKKDTTKENVVDDLDQEVDKEEKTEAVDDDIESNEIIAKVLKNKRKNEKVSKKKEAKATLLQRFLAYIVDVLLVSFLASLLLFPFVNEDEKIDKLNDEMMDVIEKYQEAKIDIKTYTTEMESITYQLAKSNGTITLITLVCEVLYFIVFQLYNGGQTIGKKFLNIKVVSDNGELTMNQMICRCLIVDSILVRILSFSIMLFANKTVYFYGEAIVEMLQYIVLLISACMITGSIDGRGIHDRLAHTRVIKI